ncbi:hypothetical protein GPJ56_002785 [Histomonas meleagridis]|uniref:uncharacterized protein n=1 Tax=Histomonas meleagridis TaxID=135588 RepID=UPI00355A5A54|nr:hypothetical protein GPJ56_002785 [Histomonas meleagridis]KAH0801971.1 hypothetical protein GO595_005246 [Histomonas meleagridis]
MNRKQNNNNQKRNVLNYNDDCILFESEHFIAIANAYQGRAHIIIRTRREIPIDAISNNLEDFNDENKQEFWHIVQQVVAEAQIPIVLCHHFGGWRSADHFHVHLVCKHSGFAKYVSYKTKVEQNQILQKLESTEKYLTNRHMNKFKKDDIKCLEENLPELDPDNFAPKEWGDYKVELDSVYPRIKFIPKQVQVFSTNNNKQIQIELTKYRSECFTAMITLAEQLGFENVYLFSNISFVYGLS